MVPQNNGTCVRCQAQLRAARPESSGSEGVGPQPGAAGAAGRAAAHHPSAGGVGTQGASLFMID